MAEKVQRLFKFTKHWEAPVPMPAESELLEKLQRSKEEDTPQEENDEIEWNTVGIGPPCPEIDSRIPF